mgnify:CR=1 FL=1
MEGGSHRWSQLVAPLANMAAGALLLALALLLPLPSFASGLCGVASGVVYTLGFISLPVPRWYWEDDDS